MRAVGSSTVWGTRACRPLWRRVTASPVRRAAGRTTGPTTGGAVETPVADRAAAPRPIRRAAARPVPEAAPAPARRHQVIPAAAVVETAAAVQRSHASGR